MVVAPNKCRLVAATFKLRTYSTQANLSHPHFSPLPSRERKSGRGLLACDYQLRGGVDNTWVNAGP